MQSLTYRLIQLTDTHLGADRQYRASGICTYTSLSKVIGSIAALSRKPEMLMVTGDIAAHGEREAYQLLAEQLRLIDIPSGCLPGNHDDLEHLQSCNELSCSETVLECGDWRLILLNTAFSTQVGGILSAGELEFLTTSLANESAHPVVIFMHHPPMSVGSPWLDEQKISNAQELEKIISSAGNVKAIFCGHVHQEFAIDWGGCRVYTTPSTCYQFAPNSLSFEISALGPGYRWLDLYPDGHFETGVRYLKAFEHSAEQR